MDMNVVLTVLIVVVSIIILWYIYMFWTFTSLKRFKGKMGLPFLGIALHLRNKSESLQWISEYNKTYGELSILTIGTLINLFVNDPAIIAQIANSTNFIEKNDVYNYLHLWLGTGLLTSYGEKWTKRRKVITPTFHFKILTSFIDSFENNADILISKLKRQLGKGYFNIFPMICLYTMDTICETAMGITLNAQTDSNNKYILAIHEVLDLIGQRIVSFHKRFDYIYRLTADYRKEVKLTNIIHEHTDEVIRKRRSLNIKLNKDLDDYGVKGKVAFLDMLMNSTIDGKPLTDEDIREEVDTFMFEGQDTTSTALGFAIYRLAKHPDIQNKVYAEVFSIFGNDKETQANFNDLQNMPYLDMVLKETLRLYPSVPVFGRCAAKDVIIDGVPFPSGYSVMISPFTLHRNPKFFPEPEKFDPERFAPENILNIKPFSYIPFSAGHRNCIGQKFAMLEMKSVLSKLLRHFEFILDPDFEEVISFESILRSVNGIRVKIIDRNY